VDPADPSGQKTRVLSSWHACQQSSWVNLWIVYCCWIQREAGVKRRQSRLGKRRCGREECHLTTRKQEHDVPRIRDRSQVLESSWRSQSTSDAAVVVHTDSDDDLELEKEKQAPRNSTIAYIRLGLVQSQGRVAVQFSNFAASRNQQTGSSVHRRAADSLRVVANCSNDQVPAPPFYFLSAIGTPAGTAISLDEIPYLP
jgi:hypothetical protein